MACLVDPGAFLTPLAPLGHANSGDIIVLRFVFDILYRSGIWQFFSFFFKLKPDITCIDLTSIKSDNITF